MAVLGGSAMVKAWLLVLFALLVVAPGKWADVRHRTIVQSRFVDLTGVALPGGAGLKMVQAEDSADEVSAVSSRRAREPAGQRASLWKI